LDFTKDTAKTVNFSSDSIRIDYNRAGIGLIEIVTNPDIRSGKEAAMCFRKIQRILKELDICDGSLEAVRIQLFNFFSSF
jgi:aspartyl-tRNA(Asn)/glutamyl-tRNA(Gln) amidotransferase subunit B